MSHVTCFAYHIASPTSDQAQPCQQQSDVACVSDLLRPAFFSLASRLPSTLLGGVSGEYTLLFGLDTTDATKPMDFTRAHTLAPAPGARLKCAHPHPAPPAEAEHERGAMRRCA